MIKNRGAGKQPVRVALVGFPLGGGSDTLSLGFLKTYADSLLKGRVNIRIFEYNPLFSISGGDGAAFESIIGDILAFSPHIVGFSCYAWSTMPAIKLSIKLRERLKGPQPLIVLGGPDAAGRGKAVLLESKADALVPGEGEATFGEMLARFLAGKPWEGTPGTWVRKGRRLTPGPPRKFIENLDTIPSPYLAGFYRGCKSNDYMTLETSRGCRRDCSFCAWTYKKSRIRNFSLNRVEAEIEWIVRNASGNNTEIFICDADMWFDPDRAVKILKMIKDISKGRSLQWTFQTDFRGWNEETARMANWDGFSIEVGVDSLNENALEIAHRKSDMESLERNLSMCRKYAPNARVRIQLMYGMPGDTLEGYLRSMDWAWQKGISNCFFHTMILPGSRYHAQAARLGIKYEPKPPYYVISLPGFSKKDIRRAEWLSFQTTVMMSRSSTEKVLGGVRRSCGGSVTRDFEKKYPAFKAGLKSSLNSAWRNYRKLPPFERAKIDWRVTDCLTRGPVKDRRASV